MLARADLKTGFSLIPLNDDDDDVGVGDDDDEEELERYCATCRHEMMEVNEENDDDDNEVEDEPNRRD